MGSKNWEDPFKEELFHKKIVRNKTIASDQASKKHLVETMHSQDHSWKHDAYFEKDNEEVKHCNILSGQLMHSRIKSDYKFEKDNSHHRMSTWHAKLGVTGPLKHLYTWALNPVRSCLTNL